MSRKRGKRVILPRGGREEISLGSESSRATAINYFIQPFPAGRGIELAWLIEAPREFVAVASFRR